jgi:hypothetical protein
VSPTQSFAFTASHIAGANSFNSIAGLDALLAANNVSLTASFNIDGSIALTSTIDDQAVTNRSAFVALGPNSVNIDSINSTGAFAGGTVVINPTPDLVSQAARANLVGEYNQVLSQITTTAQDSSFNGVNLLNGDSLKLVFDETGKSSVTITGVTFDPTGLGLAALIPGKDFIDNNSTDDVLTALNTASITLRSQASAFGANLSIVQIRQDFNKNIINVLQSGSSNLTLADSNEEAANSQALSTRQSIATSALALANQSQQNVLQLLR